MDRLEQTRKIESTQEVHEKIWLETFKVFIEIKGDLF